MTYSREQIEHLINQEVDKLPASAVQDETRFVATRLLETDVSLNQQQIDALANSLQYVNKLDVKQSMISTVNLLTELGVFTAR